MTRPLAAIVLTVAVTLGAAPAAAQSESEKKALAASLFDEGWRAFEAGKIADACAKFEASVATMPLYNARFRLAACFEKLGRTASAWIEFREAAAQAARLKDPRGRDSEARALALEKSLVRLAIHVEGEAPGMAVSRDGVALQRAAFDVFVPVDPGEHRLAATAPGHRSWESSVLVDGKQKEVTVTVPSLDKVPEPEPPVAGAAPSPEGPAPEPVDPGRSRRLAAYVAAGAGVALVGVGAVFGLKASSQWSDAQAMGCVADGCPQRSATDLVDSARSSATVSTVLVATGCAAIVTGAILYFTAPSAAERTARLRILPIAGPGAGLFVAEGTF